VKELHFGEGVFVKFLERGKGAVTIRAGVRDFVPGELALAVCAEGDYFLVRIVSCDYRRLISVSDQDLRDDGFASRREALDRLRVFYPKLGYRSLVTVIRLEVLERIEEEEEERMLKKIFVLGPENPDPAVSERLTAYVAGLESRGHRVVWLSREEQNLADGVGVFTAKWIADAASNADEIHIWWDSAEDSVWTAFSLGVLFSLLREGAQKSVVLVNPEDVSYTPGKDLGNVVLALISGSVARRRSPQGTIIS